MSIDLAIETILAETTSDQRRMLLDVLTEKCGGPGSGVPGPCPVGGADASGGKSGIWINPKPKTAKQLSGKDPEDGTAVKKVKAYHVTLKENVASIMANGFDLSKVRPRWQNDLAVSLSKGKAKALEYFSESGNKINSKKYALLEVEMKGAYTKAQLPLGHGIARNPKEYTKLMVDSGYDGQDLGTQFYVHNPKSILSIRSISIDG